MPSEKKEEKVVVAGNESPIVPSEKKNSTWARLIAQVYGPTLLSDAVER